MRRQRGTGSLYQRGATWWIRYSVDGRTYRESTSSTEKRAAAALLRSRLASAALGQHAPKARVTLDDLARLVEDNYRANDRRSLRRAQQALAHVIRLLGNAKAEDITCDRLERYVTARRAEDAALGTIALELAALRRGFTLAVRSRRLHQQPPFPTLSVKNARTGFFEDHELSALLAELPDYLRAPLTFAFLTGWRLSSEVLPLRWSQVDLTAGVVRLEPGTTKNGDGREWPIGALPELQSLLEAQRAATSEIERATGRSVQFVFHRHGDAIKSIRSAWSGACRRAGIVDRIPHDFRRTAVRNLERAGVPRSVAMRLVGHRTEGIYRRYAIVATRDLAEGVAKLANLRVEAQLKAHSAAERFPVADQATVL